MPNVFDKRKIAYMRTRDLVPNPNNARTHSRRQIEQIARSIERFGFNNPILIDSGKQILAGHGRVAAAKLLGIDPIPALKIEHLTDVEKRAYVLADNRLAERAGWDNDILAIELQGLVDLDFDIELTGFETGEIDVLLDGENTAGDDADDICPDYDQSLLSHMRRRRLAPRRPRAGLRRRPGRRYLPAVASKN